MLYSDAVSNAISNALVMFKMNQIPTWVKLVSSPNNRKIDLKVVEIEYQNLYPTRNMNANTCWQKTFYPSSGVNEILNQDFAECYLLMVYVIQVATGMGDNFSEQSAGYF